MNVTVTGGLSSRRGSDSEAASSGFTPPDAPFANAPEEPSRMIEREEIPEVLPVLVQQPSFIDYAGVGVSHSSVAPHALSHNANSATYLMLAS